MSDDRYRITVHHGGRRVEARLAFDYGAATDPPRLFATTYDGRPLDEYVADGRRWRVFHVFTARTDERATRKAEQHVAKLRADAAAKADRRACERDEIAAGRVL